MIVPGHKLIFLPNNMNIWQALNIIRVFVYLSSYSGQHITDLKLGDKLWIIFTLFIFHFWGNRVKSIIHSTTNISVIQRKPVYLYQIRKSQMYQMQIILRKCPIKIGSTNTEVSREREEKILQRYWVILSYIAKKLWKLD
jgi:hypothetical protein